MTVQRVTSRHIGTEWSLTHVVAIWSGRQDSGYPIWLLVIS